MQLRQSITYSQRDYRSLYDGITRAIAKAQTVGMPIIFSYSQAWDCANPLLLLASKSEHRQPKFYWEEANKGLILAAAGAVAEIAIANQEGGDRFDLAKKFIKKHLDLAIAAADDMADLSTAIHVLGAFSFYQNNYQSNYQSSYRNSNNRIDPADTHRTDIEFPSLLFFIPRWLLRQSAATCILTVNDQVQPWDEVDTVLARLDHWRSHLQATSCYQSPTLHEINQIQEVQGRQVWTEIVERALQLIHQGHFQKVVLARALDVLANRAFDPFQILHVLRCEYPECISFLLDYGAGKTFLGATPEIVLQFKAQGDRLRLRSDALAGSIGRGKTVKEDRQLAQQLLQSEKDRREHQFVIRSICDRLQTMGANIDPQVNTKLLKLSNVQHLHTPITAEIHSSNWLIVLDILQQLHPTAAVGGVPRDRAVCFMQQWEACDRGWYAAPIGWLNGNGEGTFGVGIRSGYIQGDRARIFAGAGIVANSQVANEQSETTIKFAALLKALGAI